MLLSETLRQGHTSRYDVFVADEVFVSGTAAELVPVTKVDDRVIGTGKAGPIFKTLLQAYRESVKKEGAVILK